MLPKPHQLVAADQLWEVMKQYKYAYLQALPRTGKTLSALLTLEKSKRVQNILVLTPKNAIPGWETFTTDEELIAEGYITKNYTIINYEAVGKYKTRTHSKSGKLLKNPVKELALKIDPDDYDAVIVDESHRLGKIGKPTQRYKILQDIINGKPHLHLSGTAYVESPNSIYYQMHFPPYSPFIQENFYDFHRDWGIPAYLKLFGRSVIKYHVPKPELLPYIEEFTVRMTQEDAEIELSSQAEDILHYVEPSAGFVQMYNQLQADLVIELPTGHTLVADTVMKLRTSLHQMESGTVKIDEETIDLEFNEKIDYIKNTWGDKPGVGIMSYYIGEQKKLQQHFKHAELYSSIKHAEGVNLSHLDYLIVFSFGFSGAKFIQLRDRKTNINNKNKNDLHILLTRGSISEQVYNAVSQKNNFNDKLFQRKTL